MTEDTLLPFDLPAVQRKKVAADFAGGSISSDGGLVLLRAAESRLGLAETLAGCIREWRDPARTVHPLPAMLRFRMFAIACGYEDADDCDELRGDPLFKLAVGRAPESGRDLCSQPTMSRLENAPSRSEVARMTVALVDIFCRSFSFFGAVALSIVYDNDRCLVSRIERDGTRRRTRLFSGFLSRYLIGDRYGRPGEGNDKGAVEGLVGWSRRNFMVPLPRARHRPLSRAAVRFQRLSQGEGGMPGPGLRRGDAAASARGVQVASGEPGRGSCGPAVRTRDGVAAPCERSTASQGRGWVTGCRTKWGSVSPPSRPEIRPIGPVFAQRWSPPQSGPTAHGNGTMGR